MRIDNPKTQQFLKQYKPNKKNNVLQDEPKPRAKMEDRVQVDIRKHKSFKVSENKPEDPTVSTKVLDGLNAGMINFSQKQRDVLAKIMSEKAENLDK